MTTTAAPDYSHLQPGAEVEHTSFGTGIVERLVDVHGEPCAHVDFGDPIGVKRLLLRHSPITGRSLTPDAGTFEAEVIDALSRLKVQRAAKAALETELKPPAEPFDAGRLREILARPSDPPMRVDGLIPSEASTLIVAMRKTGKTTLCLNLAHSLIEGDDFLGRFPVRPIQGRVAILNYEVSGNMLSRWAEQRGIDEDRLFLVNLRGRRNPLAHPDDRERLAQQLRQEEVETLIVDTFTRAYTGQKRSDSGEVGAFLVELDYFARTEAGAEDLILTTHAGWSAERARDSSALEDWPDSIITLTRDQEDEGQRFLKAMGRDVEIDEDQLLYDEDARTLTLAGTGSRRKTKNTRKVADLAVFVRRAASQQPGASTEDLRKLIRAMSDAPAFQDRDISKAAQQAEDNGFLRIVDNGPGKAKQHFPATPSNPVQTPSTDALSQPRPPRPYMDGVGVGVPEAAPSPLDGVTSDDDECQTCHRYTCNGTCQEAS